jgi:crotonobetainyl-CoA:carnitine CoA-transferase CaiB-like acyl-CoA transferase
MPQDTQQPEQSARDTVGRLWEQTKQDPQALTYLALTGADPVFPSSFRIGTAAQSCIAAAALAACEYGHSRGQARQYIDIDMAHAALECSGWYSIDGVFSDPWNKFTGLYQCCDGWVRVHANLPHHREGFLRLLGLDARVAQRSEAERECAKWAALDLEAKLASSGLVGSALRSFAQWDATEQGIAVASSPLFTIEKIADAAPLALAALRPTDMPLSGVRVLDLTRILAGPISGRTLAGYGADVLLVNGPHLPNIEAIADTSRGKLSALADLRKAEDRALLAEVARSAHVFVQGYRPGGLASLGFGPQDLASARPGIIYVSLSAYGKSGPWSTRKGFDSLLQTAMGFNLAERDAAGTEKPKAMPMQILDECTGYLIAFLVATVLRRQRSEGGTWHIEVSLAQTATWLRRLGRVAHGFDCRPPAVEPFVVERQSEWGRLGYIRHSARLRDTPVIWPRPSVRPGSSPLAWPS